MYAIVQADPQLHANGEVPEKCSHFSQPLVFLRSSRRRILCDDFSLESNSIHRFFRQKRRITSRLGTIQRGFS
jgi:hypothetical protein